jgi:hypothetical protein
VSLHLAASAYGQQPHAVVSVRSLSGSIFAYAALQFESSARLSQAAHFILLACSGRSCPPSFKFAWLPSAARSKACAPCVTGPLPAYTGGCVFYFLGLLKVSLGRGFSENVASLFSVGGPSSATV